MGSQEAQAQQDVASVAVVGHARVTPGAQQDGVEIVPQGHECRFTESFASGQIVIGPMRKLLK